MFATSPMFGHPLCCPRGGWRSPRTWRSCRKHDKRGLAVFPLRRTDPRGVPRMAQMNTISLVDDFAVATFDMRVVNPTSFLAVGQLQRLQDALFRCHRRSLPSTKDVSRVSINVIIPPNTAEMNQMLVLKILRAEVLPQSTLFSLKSMTGSVDAKTVECNGHSVVHHYWPLCSQMLPIGACRFLVVSDASAEAWRGVLDSIYQIIKANAATRLK
ncbi:unnamed protein product [Prorocentrum cordatum]|uniref:Uncharacterized protein n=1 Tax=Prorocentrum cordatum TaxID=2364126 RepID=A0ABN9PJJ5_9DINO|nr:unnamed protein product [Polarella glacialis]